MSNELPNALWMNLGLNEPTRWRDTLLAGVWARLKNIGLIDTALFRLPSRDRRPGGLNDRAVRAHLAALEANDLDVWYGRNLFPSHGDQAFEDVFSQAYYTAALERVHIEAAILRRNLTVKGTWLDAEATGENPLSAPFTLGRPWVLPSTFRSIVQTAAAEAARVVGPVDLIAPFGSANPNVAIYDMAGRDMKGVARGGIVEKSYGCRTAAAMTLSLPRHIRDMPPFWWGSRVSLDPAVIAAGKALDVAQYLALDRGAIEKAYSSLTGFYLYIDRDEMWDVAAALAAAAGE